MTDQKPTSYYLYVTPWVAFGHLRRPCWLLRVIQRVILGWRWYANEHDTPYAAAFAGLEEPPYSRHRPGMIGETLGSDMQVHSTDPTWQMEERQEHPR